jgi:hypothetical protein
MHRQSFGGLMDLELRLGRELGRVNGQCHHRGLPSHLRSGERRERKLSGETSILLSLPVKRLSVESLPWT